MELAEHLGGMTVGEMLARMSDDELDAWAAYARKHGLRARREELYLAQIAGLVHGAGKPTSEYLLQSRDEPEEVAGHVDVAHEVMAENVGAIAGVGVVHIKLPKGSPWLEA